jgi:hypothetical protein
MPHIRRRYYKIIEVTHNQNKTAIDVTGIVQEYKDFVEREQKSSWEGNHTPVLCT